MTRGTALLVPLALAAWLAGQGDPAAVVRDAAAAPELRCDALCTLQDRGELGTDLLVFALAQRDTALQQTAVALLRHEWLQWPAGLGRALEAEPEAALAVLEELAVAPRPAAANWVDARARDGRAAMAERLLALTARAEPPDRDAGALAVRALAGEDHGAAAQCVQRLPAGIADQLLGVAHEQLAAGVPAEKLGPLFDRLSDVGLRQLLGLAAVLDGATTAALCQQLAARDDPRYWERVRAAVDGEIPLEAHWLGRAGRLLDTPARRRRVAAIVADAGRPEPLRILAFEALLDGRAFEPELRAFAFAGGADRLRRLLRAELPGMPDEVVVEALRGDATLQLAAIDAAARRALSAKVEHRLIELLGATELDAMDATNGVAWRCLLALAASGSDDGVRAALAKARGRPDSAPAVYDLLGRRRDPIASATLVAELEYEVPRGVAREAAGPLLDHLRLVLAEIGDRRQLEQLVAFAPQRSATFVRRCRHAVPELPAALARDLLERLAAVADGDVQIELVLWLGRSTDAHVRAGLLRLWQEAEDEELREAALRGLMLGPERAELLAGFRAAEHTGDERWELLAYEATATMPDRLGDGDVRLLQHLLFDAPRRDRERERERARRFPDGRTGFPLVAAIADRMRRDPVAALAVAAPAAALARAGDVQGLVRQRYLFLWTALQALPELQQQVATATAALVLAIPDAGDAGAGPANRWLADDLAARGDHAGAAAASRRAARLLLCDPRQRVHARIHLGPRDPQAGSDPWAALAARTHLETARAELAAGRAAAARAAAGAAAELAGRDAATHAAITAILSTLPR